MPVQTINPATGHTAQNPALSLSVKLTAAQLTEAAAGSPSCCAVTHGCIAGMHPHRRQMHTNDDG